MCAPTTCFKSWNLCHPLTIAANTTAAHAVLILRLNVFTGHRTLFWNWEKIEIWGAKQGVNHCGTKSGQLRTFSGFLALILTQQRPTVASSSFVKEFYSFHPSAAEAGGGSWWVQEAGSQTVKIAVQIPLSATKYEEWEITRATDSSQAYRIRVSVQQNTKSGGMLEQRQRDPFSTKVTAPVEPLGPFTKILDFPGPSLKFWIFWPLTKILDSLGLWSQFWTKAPSSQSWIRLKAWPAHAGAQ